MIRSSDFHKNWLPGADNCRNFFERFTFCPKSLISRAKHGVAKERREPYRHPLALAYEFHELVQAGVVNNWAKIARRYGLSRARVTQVMKLLNLRQRLYSGRSLRDLLPVHDEQAQVEASEHLVQRVSKSTEA